MLIADRSRCTPKGSPTIRHAASLVALAGFALLALGSGRSKSHDSPAGSTTTSGATDIEGWDALKAADPSSSIGKIVSVEAYTATAPMSVAGSPKIYVTIHRCAGAAGGYLYTNTTNRAVADRVPMKPGCAAVRVRLDKHDNAGWHGTLVD
jgi:hypothetical protein